MKTTHLILTLALLSVAAVVACGGDDDSDNTPTASAIQSTTASPSTTPSVEDEVGAAYLNYWDVYTEAVFNLDESRLEEVMTGPQLQRTLEEVSSLRQQNRAAKIDVEHNFVVLNLDLKAGTAVVRDEYANHSSFVDAETKELIGQPAGGEIIEDTYSLTQVGEAWKVEDSVRDSE
jgi:Cys-tRNA synthase (O-phospho-L-seryl-tRNA:Cys-tRNA synthase)